MIPSDPHSDQEPTNPPEPGPETEPVAPEPAPSDPIPAHVEDPVEEGEAFTPDDADQDDGEA